MKTVVMIWTLAFLAVLVFIKPSQAQQQELLPMTYFGDTLQLPTGVKTVSISSVVNDSSIRAFYNQLNQPTMMPLVEVLMKYKEKKQLDDWLYYQLIRRTAQYFSPKETNYQQYTLYKWFLLRKSGYDAQLAFADKHLLFYVQSNDNIYDIPLFQKEGKQYVCLNIHDIGSIDFSTVQLNKVNIDEAGEEGKSFSYKVNQLPDFKTTVYEEKELVFQYKKKEDRYSIKVDPFTARIFKNYPTVDFASYFNIPLSNASYGSLIPALKKKLKGMRQEKGVEYLMQFTRYAFMYADDEQNFGKEKRMSPEQTLLNDYSDCDDRVALFYYLVKEMYNLPMIVLLYPTHVTLAIAFKKPIGAAVWHNGRHYSVCEPTPQRLDLPMGSLMPELANAHFDVAYEYIPIQ